MVKKSTELIMLLEKVLDQMSLLVCMPVRRSRITVVLAMADNFVQEIITLSEKLTKAN